MKNSWKHTAQRVMSLILSFILTLTLITPTLAAGEVYDNDTDTTPPTGELQTPPTPEDEAADEDDPTAITPFSLMRAATNSLNAYEVEPDAETGKVYKIETEWQLAWLAQEVNNGNNFSGKTISLTNDIDLSAVCGEGKGNWTPIGTSSKKFSGTFDGQGHTISGLYINEVGTVTSAAYKGLFGYNTGKIQNLVVTGKVHVKSKSNSLSKIAGVAGDNSGTVQNCGFYGAVTTLKKDDTHATGGNGGVVGTGTCNNCWYWRTDNGASDVGVCGVNNKSTNSYHNVTGVPNRGTIAASLNTDSVISGLNAGGNGEATGMVWAVGTTYPTLKAAPKTITLQPIFPDYGATVTVNGTALTEANEYTYTVTDDTANISISAGENTFFYAASESEKNYATGLTEVTNACTYTGKFPVTLYYGMEADFDLLAAWNSALQSNGTTANITTPDQLNAVARMVNSGKDGLGGKTITLTQNITPSGDWTPIGTDTNPFSGTFNGNAKTISNLAGDLFGVVATTEDASVGASVSKVNITGTGLLVDTLKSGKVQYCSSTASVSTGGGLVGTKPGGTVTSCYYYNTSNIGTKVVGTGTATNCYYLAATSTFGETGAADTGARTAEEFRSGQVTWELNSSSSWRQRLGVDNYPVLSTLLENNPENRVYRVKAAVVREEGMPDDVNVKVTVGAGAGNENTMNGAGTVYANYGAQLSYEVVKGSSNGAYVVNCSPNFSATVSGNIDYTFTISKETADYSWYVGKSSPYTIKTPAQLQGLAKLVNGTAQNAAVYGNDDYSTIIFDFSNTTVNLVEDIDLAGYDWTPIGVSNSFMGTFNGNNKEITGLSVVSTQPYVGLFGRVDGTVRNLSVSGTVTATAANAHVGGIVGSLASGTIKNCLSNVTVTATGSGGYVGGVVGNAYDNATIDQCWNEGNVTSTNSWAGGIAGSGSATNCKNVGTVTYTGSDRNAFAYGIAKSATNCYNTGDVNGNPKDEEYDIERTYGIGSAVTNSYCICKVNGTETMQYIKSGTNSANITYDAESKTYTVGADTLVDKLNANRGSNTPWFVNYDKYVYAPIHVLTWKGEKDERFEGTVVTVTYDPNGGINKDGSNTPVPVTVTLLPDTTTGEVKAEYEILSATAEELGFKHENGTFDKWTTGETGGAEYAVGRDVSLTEDLTLYAQWTPVWEGNGTIGDPYKLKNETDLKNLQAKVNDEGFNYADKWFKLTNSIALTGNWTPIGAFAGNLDGGNCTISGINVTGGRGAGLFNQIGGAEVTIKDLTLSGSFTANGGAAGALACTTAGNVTLDNVHANVTVTAPTGTVGGLIGRGSVVTMTGCTVSGSVTGLYAGGLMGGFSGDNVSGRGNFTGCVNSAAVTSEEEATYSTLGGAAGIAYSTTYNVYITFTDCRNEGSIKAEGDAAGIGMAGSYTNCRNSNSVTSNKGDASGIVQNGRAIERCFNSGNITGKEAAGIVHTQNSSVEMCGNIGEVKSTGRIPLAYGIAAKMESYKKIQYCFSYVANLPLAPAKAKDKVADSYYLADKKGSVSSAGEWASEADFSCGKVAWGVDGGVGNHQGWWTQDEGAAYPKLLDEADKSKSYFRALISYGTGGAAVLTSGEFSSADQDDAVYGPAGTSVTVTATPYDDTYVLKSLKLDLMSSDQFVEIESGSSFNLSQANAEVVAVFTGGGTGGGGGTGSGGEGQGDGNGEGDGSGSEEDTGLQSGSNPDVEYDVKNLVLSAYGAWGAEGSGKAFVQWLQSNAQTLRNLVTNSLDNMAGAARGKSSGDAAATAAALLANLNTYCGVDSKSATSIGRALQQYLDSASTDSFTGWLTSGSGMASGTVEAILTQYTESLLALTDRLYTKWESSGTSMTFPQWLDAQQVSMENLSESAQEPEQDTTNDPQTTDAPEDVPDGQESEGGSAGGGNSIWAVIGDAVRQNPIIVWSIVAAIVAIVVVGAVRRYHKVKKDERDDK